ncbi:flagellar basal body rod protein FlgB [bacterium]|nr:flagellar basal body rod protein FlgB [bacterium]
MFIDILSYDRIPKILGKVLDCTSKVQDVISSNVANAETPGYKSKEVSFQSLLNSYIDQIDIAEPGNQDIESYDFDPEISELQGGKMRRDGNNVDMDYEMVALAQNQIRNNMAVQLLRKKLNMLSFSIMEGR